jgi:riboflavin kinase/FMN adenylyltransferase
MEKASMEKASMEKASMEKASRIPAAATIGVFDGVHRGHQELLKRVAAAARDLPGVAVAVTFSRHPLAVLNPARCPAPLTTVEERRALLLAQGITEVKVIEFDRAMSKLSAREFLEAVLLDRYALKVLVVGPDFAMGRDRAGDVAALAAIGSELGFRLEVVEPVAGLGGPVSSTRLRQALAAGEMDGVRELLGRHYQLAGTVVVGHGRGREIGFPTANLAIEEGKMLPGDGVYAALASVGSDLNWQPAVVNVGVAPTFGEGERRVEIHLLRGADEPGASLGDSDLRGRRLAVRFVARLRGEQRFPGVEALRAQIQADITAAWVHLERRPARSGIS